MCCYCFLRHPSHFIFILPSQQVSLLLRGRDLDALVLHLPAAAVVAPHRIEVSLYLKWNETRFGPNRPAADMEENGEIEFWGLLETFLRIFGNFLRNFGEICSL